MGLLSLGTPLDWPEAQALAEHVREHGITQFLNLWAKIKDRRGDGLLWGDEIEYIVVAFDDGAHDARLSLRQAEILGVLAQSDAETRAALPAGRAADIPTFHPEYGRFMLESTPGAPYGVAPRQLCLVEANMRLRRRIARKHLLPHELPVTLTSFPRLGVTDAPFTEPPLEARGNASRSLFLPDEVINPHARFPTLTANIRKRRGAKVAINMPIFHDTNTPRPFIDPSIPRGRDWFPEDAEAAAGAALPDHIYMDAMGFGMGCCCLQTTFQACSVQEARTVYDQLIPVGPLMLALTAASPAYRGYLADVDCRWNVISAAVDDRTKEERGLEPLKHSRMVMPKSR
jgi:glutamate--cysteine ligase catalytic subunit